MRLANHVMTGAVAALVLGFNWGEVPLVMAGTCLPNALERLLTKIPQISSGNEKGSHAILLWLALLILSLAMLPDLRIGEVVIHLWSLAVGALIHVFFDALSRESIPILPTRRTPRVSLKLYRTGDVISEDTFVWLFMAAGVFLWLFKNNH